MTDNPEEKSFENQNTLSYRLWYASFFTLRCISIAVMIGLVVFGFVWLSVKIGWPFALACFWVINVFAAAFIFPENFR